MGIVEVYPGRAGVPKTSSSDIQYLPIVTEQTLHFFPYRQKERMRETLHFFLTRQLRL
jgi:hypothetical protein